MLLPSPANTELPPKQRQLQATRPSPFHTPAPSGATLDAQVTVKVSNIAYTAPTNLTMAAGETLAVSAAGYASDGTFSISCADATSISNQFSSVSRTANTCNYSAVAKATAAAGSPSFTVPYTSSGGDTHNGVITITITAISYTAPTDLKVIAGSNTDITASGWASHSGYTISCGDAKSIHAKLTSVTRTANTCNYRITANTTATAGNATFTIPYTSTSGATLDAQVTVKVSNIAYTAPTTLSMAAGETLAVSAAGYASDGTFAITCADATSISTQFSSVSRTANTCNYSAVAKATATAGSATFTVPYTSSGGDTQNGVITITITAISYTAPNNLKVVAGSIPYTSTSVQMSTPLAGLPIRATRSPAATRKASTQSCHRSPEQPTPATTASQPTQQPQQEMPPSPSPTPQHRARH